MYTERIKKSKHNFDENLVSTYFNLKKNLKKKDSPPQIMGFVHTPVHAYAPSRPRQPLKSLSSEKVHFVPIPLTSTISCCRSPQCMSRWFLNTAVSIPLLRRQSHTRSMARVYILSGPGAFARGMPESLKQLGGFAHLNPQNIAESACVLKILVIPVW